MTRILVLLLGIIFFGPLSFGQKTFKSENILQFYEDACYFRGEGKQPHPRNLATVLLYAHYYHLYTNITNGNTKEALHALRLCTALNEKVQNDAIGINLDIIRGTLFDIFDLYDEGLQNFNAAKNKLPTQKQWNAYLLSNICTSHLELQEYDTAFSILIDWQRTINDSTPQDLLKTNYFNLGQCYKYAGQLDSAMYFVQKSLDIEKALKDTTGIAESYMEIGNLYYQQYIDDTATTYFKNAYDLSKAAGDFDFLKYATLNMAIVEENNNNLSAALHYRKEYDAIRDSLDNRDQLWNVAKDDKEFALDIKQREIAVIEREKSLQTLQLQSERRERNLFLLTALLLFVLLAGIVVLYRRSVARNKIIEQQRLTLEALNHTKNEILSIVAHDLKTPIFQLTQNNQTLQNTLQADVLNDDQKAFFQSNVQLGNTTYQLINNLLHWALEQSNQFHFQKEPINIARIVSLVVFDFQPLLDQKEIKLAIEIEDRSKAFIDMNSLKIILRNLLDNAIKFTPEYGTIEIQMIEHPHDENAYALRIKDSGQGMSQEAIDQCLNKQLRFSTRDTSGRSGTGLGLNLCHALIEKNDGTMSIHSAEGIGTTIELKLKKYASN